MPTLLLSPRYSVDSIALRNAAIAAGWRVERLHNYAPPDSLGADQSVIYGEAIFAQLTARALGLELIQTSACWLANLPEQYRKREVQCTTLEEARKHAATAFFKPANEKAFDAQVYESGAALPILDEWAEAIPVLICEPVVWEVEYRCFVLDRIPLTISVYKRRDQTLPTENGEWLATPEETQQALSYCQTVLRDTEIEAPNAFVMDVGIISDRGWAVVEANPAWASGIYGCEPDKVLAVLAYACK